ncbi:MAG: hypothetical protein GIW95_10275 [Candidatus Eremiobacteraeota bacterium]|nr:hypothetical protein [Candidatus Eremiobacteraeota bacterium]
MKAWLWTTVTSITIVISFVLLYQTSLKKWAGRRTAVLGSAMLAILVVGPFAIRNGFNFNVMYGVLWASMLASGLSLVFDHSSRRSRKI